ncbi:MAG: hypothetical protein FWH14_06695 [Oscillospiraceae bacterium]|nr:hypothetical protein [Oscillospiraceae bacterium]
MFSALLPSVSIIALAYAYVNTIFIKIFFRDFCVFRGFNPPFPSGEGCRRSGGVVFPWCRRSGGVVFPWCRRSGGCFSSWS